MALVVADTAHLLGYNILGFVDDTPEASTELDGIKVINHLPAPNGGFNLIVAIGDCDARLSISERLEKCGYDFATLVHPAAIISSSAILDKGVFIAAGAIIDPHVSIGKFTIINNCSVISHGTYIGNACHLAPHSVVAGNCVLGNAVWIGLGAKVIENMNIANRSFIGAGAVVVKNTNTDTMNYGVPAKEIRKR